MTGRGVHRLFRISAISGAVLLVVALSFTEYLYLPLYVDHPPERAEAIVVLSSSGYDAGIPNMRTLARLQRGLELYRQGYAPRIVCLGGTPVQDFGMTVAEQMKRTLVLFGVEPGRIMVEDRTRNTYHDLAALMERFEGEIDFGRVLFVTSSYHTRRVAAVLRHLGVEEPMVLSAPFWERKPGYWGERFDLLIQVTREYMAFVYFWLRGWV